METFADIDRQWKSKVPHESDFFFFRNVIVDSPMIVDVGANAGQSVASFDATCPGGRIVSFEPNERYRDVLEHIKSDLVSDGRFQYHMVGCGKSSALLDLHVPYVGGEPYFQEASLSADHFQIDWVRERLLSYGGELTFRSFQITIEPVDDFNLSPHLCKIDAEGWEFDVLQGMTSTISRQAPIFLIENNDYNQVTAFLGDRGYRAYEYIAAENRVEPLSRATANSFYLRPDHARWLVADVARGILA